MGQKVNPIAMRLGYIENWRSLWFADKNIFRKNVVEDYKIRKFVLKRFEQAAVSRVIIERLAEKIKIIIHSARPGIIVGRGGIEIKKLNSDISQLIGRTGSDVLVDTKEVKTPSIDAQLVAQNIAFQLQKRVAFRRALKRSIENAISAGAKGIKLKVSGRLNGAEMARSEGYKEGKLPLQTLRAEIDYGFAEALTTYGIIGVKVWIYKGEVIKEIKRQGIQPETGSQKK